MGQTLTQNSSLAEANPEAFRRRIKRVLGPSVARRIGRLSRFSVFRGLIHPDPEVQRWNAIAWRVAKETGFKVAAGPFKGLDLKPTGEPRIRELLGVYEEELHPWIEMLVSHGYKSVIDIGAACGYYAVGLATRTPGVNVLAFEQQKVEAEVLARVAERNGVSSRLTVRGHCDQRSLAEALEGRGGSLIVSDCEGAEFHLLEPSKIPALYSCDLLVEVHGYLDLSLSQALEGRFQNSHWLFRITPRIPADNLSADPTQQEKSLSQIPSELRPAGAYWLLLLRRGEWSPQAAVSD